MTNGLYSIAAYLGANYALVGLAAVAYFFWREVGAAAAGGVGQLLVNAGSVYSNHLPSEATANCTNVVVLIGVLPAVLFAFLPTACEAISQRRVQNGGFVDFMIFSSLYFAVTFANSFALVIWGASGAAEDVSGPFLLSLILGGAAVAVGKSRTAVLDALMPATRALDSEADEGRALGRSAPAWGSAARSDQPISGPSHTRPIGAPASLSSAPTAKQVASRSRPPVASPTYLFNRNEFFIFRAEHLQDLENLLRREPPGVLEGLQLAICRRLGRVPVEGDERGFVQAYVAQFRKRLEASRSVYFVPDRIEVAAA